MSEPVLSEAVFFNRYKVLIDLFEESDAITNLETLELLKNRISDCFSSLEQIMYPIHYRLYSAQYYRLSERRTALFKRLQRLRVMASK
ncbi:MAG: hypothetical protein RTU30_04070 [Candidatus Thorarchaeota archaeon]